MNKKVEYFEYISGDDYAYADALYLKMENDKVVSSIEGQDGYYKRTNMYEDHSKADVEESISGTDDSLKVIDETEWVKMENTIKLREIRQRNKKENKDPLAEKAGVLEDSHRRRYRKGEVKKIVNEGGRKLIQEEFDKLRYQAHKKMKGLDR